MHLFANVTLMSPYIFQKQDVGLDAPARQQSRCSSTVQQIVMFGGNTGCSLALVQHIVHLTRSEGCIGQLHASLPTAKAKVGPKLVASAMPRNSRYCLQDTAQLRCMPHSMAADVKSHASLPDVELIQGPLHFLDSVQEGVA